MMGEGAKAKVMDFSFMGKKFANCSPTPWGCKKSMAGVCHELAVHGCGVVNTQGQMGGARPWACGLAPMGSEL
jgi:hypothetical protein